MDDLHSKVLRKFHTLCGLCGLTDEEKKAIVGSYGVESSADISTHDLIDICGSLSGKLGKSSERKDNLRKRVFASIGGYLKKIGGESSPEIIKGIACRATGYKEFNRIPEERLRNIYYTFLNKQKDIDTTEDVATSILMATAFSGSQMAN